MATGLLTLLVTHEQAAKAIEAAYGPAVHECAGSLYLDDATTWWSPVGVVKFAPPAHQPKEDTMSIIDTIAGTAHKAAVAVGLAEHHNAARYRQARAIIDRRAEIRERQLEASRRLQAAIAARKAGAFEFEGRSIDFAIHELEQQHTAAANHAARAAKAENEAIDACPDQGLQRERRQLREQKRRLLRQVQDARQQVEKAALALKRDAAAVEAMPAGSDERRRADEALATDRDSLRWQQGELAELEGQVNRMQAAIEANRARMLSIEI